MFTINTRWSATEGTEQQGNISLHAQLAKAYNEAGEYPFRFYQFISFIVSFAYAQKHYLKSNQPKEFGEMIIKWASEGYPSERDLYIARSVLM